MNVCMHRSHVVSGKSNEGIFGKLSWLVEISIWLFLYNYYNYVSENFGLTFKFRGTGGEDRKEAVNFEVAPSDTVHKENEFVVFQEKGEQLLLEMWRASQKGYFYLN